MAFIYEGSAAQTTAAARASSKARQADFAPSIPASFDPPMLGERVLQQPSVGSYIVYGDCDSAVLTREGTTQSKDSGKKNVPFKEKVLGFAQKTRGAVMKKPELKEHGEMILQGETAHAQD